MEPIEEIETEMESIHKERVTIIRKLLFRNAVMGNWKQVVRIHEEEPMAHAAKITTSGDTALHMAVSDGQEKIVELLVKAIVKDGGRPRFPRMENDRNNTPLHLAASVGSARMCECIAAIDSELIGARNRDMETPFLLAAIHGKIDAFICLHFTCGIKKGYSYCRRKDGDNILHCAIAEEYFDLAFYIAFWYGDLVFFNNERGLSPLHLLAMKPSAFKSGSNFGWLDRIFYHCIWIDKLKKPTEHFREAVEKNRKSLGWPENYRTCLNYFQLLRKFVQAISRKESPKNPEGDVESEGAPPHLFEGRNESEQGAQGHQLSPSNYDTCSEFIKRLWMVLAIPLGRTNAIRKLRNKKEKHIWSDQVMNELLQYISTWEYVYEGKNPDQTQQLTYKDDERTAYGTAYSTILEYLQEEDPRPSPTVSQATNPKDPKHEAKKSKGSSMYEVEDKGQDTYKAQSEGDEVFNPEAKVQQHGEGEEKNPERVNGETPILIAAKNGVVEMVEKILELFPVAIHDMNLDEKNMVLLAVENRQPHVYQLLLRRDIVQDSAFRKVDGEGNSALHIAAMLGEHRPRLLPDAVLQMQWEIKWYEFVRKSRPPGFFLRYNKAGQTPKEVFAEKHNKLVYAASRWLNGISNSCFLVATLVTTVAFATSATVPGGLREKTGVPTFEGQPTFFSFAFSSLSAMCFSVISLITFLSILTTEHQVADFHSLLPKKFLLALTTLLLSIVSMLISFCSSHFFVVKEKLKLNAYLLYVVLCLAVSLSVLFQFPFYSAFMRSTFSEVPQPGVKRELLLSENEQLTT